MWISKWYNPISKNRKSESEFIHRQINIQFSEERSTSLCRAWRSLVSYTAATHLWWFQVNVLEVTIVQIQVSSVPLLICELHQICRKGHEKLYYELHIPYLLYNWFWTGKGLAVKSFMLKEGAMMPLTFIKQPQLLLCASTRTFLRNSSSSLENTPGTAAQKHLDDRRNFRIYLVKGRWNMQTRSNNLLLKQTTNLLWASSLGLSLAFSSSSNSTDIGTQICMGRYKPHSDLLQLLSQNN